MTSTKLLEAHRELSKAIRASEDWQPSYKANKSTFKALLTHEGELLDGVGTYLAGLAERAPNYVDWNVYTSKVQASTDGQLDKGDDVWRIEETLFTAAVLDAIEQLVATGALAGELTYGIPVGATLSESVLIAARHQTTELVTGVSDTNRKLIREAIRNSIARGENAYAAIERIQKIISNPVRAEMIAQTESVNAYQTGLKNFAKQTGAVSKEWEALAGACRICSPVHGEVVDIDELFSNGKDRPSAHPRCRCGLIYNY